MHAVLQSTHTHTETHSFTKPDGCAALSCGGVNTCTLVPRVDFTFHVACGGRLLVEKDVLIIRA